MYMYNYMYTCSAITKEPVLIFEVSLLYFHVCIFSASQYLSNADERLAWQANALPSDDLCIENAIMIKRFNRYPLIIDPSGQATEFIMNEYRGRKITKTRSGMHIFF